MDTTRQERWSKIPTVWIRYDGGLKNFSIQDIGGHAAALKIYMSIALLAAYRNKPPRLYAGQASMSYDQFEELTGLSRSLIPRGLAVLRERGLVQVIDTEKIHSYRLVGYEDETLGWGKIPRDHLRSGRLSPGGRLAALGHRHQVDLNSLKIYLALVAFRDGASGYSMLSYDKIVEHTGVHRSRIRPALTSLFDAQLVAVDSIMDHPAKSNAANRYVVLGLSGKRAASTEALPVAPTSHFAAATTDTAA